VVCGSVPGSTVVDVVVGATVVDVVEVVEVVDVDVATRAATSGREDEHAARMSAAAAAARLR